MTIKERLTKIETELKYIKKLIIGLAVLIAGQTGINFI